MRKTRILLAPVALAVAAIAGAAAPALAEGMKRGDAVVHKTHESFEDTRDNVVDAVIDRGMVVTYHAYIANMLERTSDAVGAGSSKIEEGEGIFFCQASLTHDLLKESLHNIVHCPYAIYIYEGEDDDDVYVAYRKAGRNAGPAARKVDAMLAEIVEEALD